MPLIVSWLVIYSYIQIVLPSTPVVTLSTAAPNIYYFNPFWLQHFLIWYCNYKYVNRKRIYIYDFLFKFYMMSYSILYLSISTIHNQFIFEISWCCDSEIYLFIFFFSITQHKYLSWDLYHYTVVILLIYVSPV